MHHPKYLFPGKVEVFDSAGKFLNSNFYLSECLLVLDIQMPGMNGLELQRYLTEAGVAVPIIFITAHEDNKAHTKATDLGAATVLQKPFEDNALIDVIQEVLGL